MAASRKKRRADGSLRPAVRRSKAKRKGRERRAWLAQFEPGVRERFFQNIVLEEAVFLRPFAREHGMMEADAAQILEHLAESKRWRKLRTKDGTVVGIAPPKEAGRGEA